MSLARSRGRESHRHGPLKLHALSRLPGNAPPQFHGHASSLAELNRHWLPRRPVQTATQTTQRVRCYAWCGSRRKVSWWVNVMARFTVSRYQNDGIDPYQTWTQQPLVLDSFPQTIRRLCASAHKTWIVDVFFAGCQLDRAMGNGPAGAEHTVTACLLR